MTEVPKTGRPRDFSVLLVKDDWLVDDVKTEEDCERAFVILTQAIAKIEGDLAEAKTRQERTGRADPVWIGRAPRALSLKNAALNEVRKRRSRLHKAKVGRTRDNLLLGILKEMEPEAFQRILAVARERFPELFFAREEGLNHD